MINFKRIKVSCPRCQKKICTMDIDAQPRGIYFWCTRCKKEFEIDNTKKYRAHEAND